MQRQLTADKYSETSRSNAIIFLKFAFRVFLLFISHFVLILAILVMIRSYYILYLI